MTETLQRPAVPGSGGAAPTRRPALLVGALAGLRAMTTGLLLVVLLVVAGEAADDRSGAGALQAVRAGARVWLAASGTVLQTPTGRFSLVPLGLSALLLVLLWRAGRSVARELSVTTLGGAAAAALSVVAPCAVLTGAVARAAGTGAVQPSPVTALLGGALLASLGAGAGALSADGLRHPDVLGPVGLWRAGRRPRGARVRRTSAAAITAVAVVLAGGALLGGASLVAHGERSAAIFGAAPGPLGGGALLLVGLAYLPTAVVWGACWLVGPGVAVGAGTAVGPFSHELGAVPALPLLAALPSGAAPTWAGALALLVPLTAGALAGAVLLRSAAEGRSRGAALLDVLLTAAWSGAAIAVLATLSTGAAGGQRLAQLGPSPVLCGLAFAAETAAGALLAVEVLRRRAARA